MITLRVRKLANTLTNKNDSIEDNKIKLRILAENQVEFYHRAREIGR